MGGGAPAPTAGTQVSSSDPYGLLRPASSGRVGRREAVSPATSTIRVAQRRGKGGSTIRARQHKDERVALSRWEWNQPNFPGVWVLHYGIYTPGGGFLSDYVRLNDAGTCWRALEDPVLQAAGVGGVTTNSQGWLAWTASEAEMEAVVQTTADEPSVNQPFSASSWWPVPSMTTESLQTLRNAITAEGTALQNEINAALDPENWQRPLPTTTPVGATPTDVGGPRYVEWLAPAVGETYDEYLARLRNRGWVGQAVEVELDGSQGNVEKGLGAVSCTSIASNAIVSTGADVTVYVNPTAGPFGNDEAPTTGHTCGTTEATSRDEPECSFAQEHGTWAQITLGNELWYSVLCDEARSYALSINLFASDGTPNPSMSIETIAEGEDIYDADVRNALADPGSGRSIAEFRKVKSQYYSPPGSGHEFNMHFYIDDTIDKAVLSLGYKIRFRQLYGP